MSKRITKIAGMFLLLALISGSAISRTSPDMTKSKDLTQRFSSVDPPAYCIVDHRVGQIVLAVKNNGTFGQANGNDISDCLTGEELLPCEYPKNSRSRYLYAAAFWIGAVVGRDTLVSTGTDGWQPGVGDEFNPDISPFGDLIYRSTRFPDVPSLYTNAISEEDYIAVYFDTLTEGVANDASGRPHRPLNIQVTQRSFAWSYSYAEDFVLFDYEIKNIGVSKIKDCYMGIYVDADVHAQSADGTVGAQDDICGFIETIPVTLQNCNFIDTVNIAWIADNDGDPGQDGSYTQASLKNVTATRIVRTPADTLDVSFNWWISNGDESRDFGPRERSKVGRLDDEFRNFRTGTLGTPEGDADKYYQLRNQEFDYDQIYTASIGTENELWSAPPQDLAEDLSDGYDTRYLLSFGPFDIDPGEKLPISFAYIGGKNLHSDPNHFKNTLLLSKPTEYYQGLDFSDLTLNSQWASRVYDNPGVDTDGDDYYGKSWICNLDSVYVDSTGTYKYTLADTLFYEGDGVPDFRGASPPPSPTFWVEPSAYTAKVRWNGTLSENTPDVFSRDLDFEGYRVYMGLDNREASFQLLASFDREDYNKFVFNPKKLPTAGFELKDTPFTIGLLDTLYGNMDGTFAPLSYSRTSPYIKPGFPDSVFYFEKQDFNVSHFGINTPITKVYPDAPYPSTIIPDSAQADELTEDGLLKYFEYEYEINNILPSIQHFVSVTAFDYGSPESGLASLEGSKSLSPKSFYAIDNYNTVVAENMKVATFPQPYIVNGYYRDMGYEGLSHEEDPPDRIRKINFINLPAKCEIKIFTLDGDLVREISHDKTPSDPEATIDYWDLITRNTQLAVSGVYYYTVEADGLETQIGKIVLIM